MSRQQQRISIKQFKHQLAQLGDINVDERIFVASVNAVRMWIEGLASERTEQAIRQGFRRAIEVLLTAWLTGYREVGPLTQLNKKERAAFVMWANIHTAKSCQQGYHVGVPKNNLEASLHLDNMAAQELDEFIAQVAVPSVAVECYREHGAEGIVKKFQTFEKGWKR